MKFSVTGEAVFWFAPTLAQVDLLTRLSERHYDNTCRAAGQDNSAAGGELGVLVRWKRQLVLAQQYTENSETPAVVSGTFRELDLCSKICEGTFGFPEQDRAAALAFACEVSQALQHHQYIAPSWAYVLETTEQPT